MDDFEKLASGLSKESQVGAASAMAASFKRLTGAPIMVSRNQMKFFKEAGVDCSNLMEYGRL